MKRTSRRIAVFKRKPERGAMLIELMIAMFVLATGLGALTTLIVACMTNDNRNSKDTSATLLAQKVVEELSAQNTNSTNAVILTDCAGNNWTIPSTQGTAAPTGQGAALATRASSIYYGGIGLTQGLGPGPGGFSLPYLRRRTNRPPT